MTKIDIREESMAEPENSNDNGETSPSDHETEIVTAEVSEAVAEAREREASAVERLARANAELVRTTNELYDARVRMAELEERMASINSSDGAQTTAQKLSDVAVQKREKSLAEKRYEDWTGIDPQKEKVSAEEAETAESMADYLEKQPASEADIEKVESPLDEVARQVNAAKMEEVGGRADDIGEAFVPEEDSGDTEKIVEHELVSKPADVEELEGKVKDLREQIIAKAVNPDETTTAEKPYHSSVEELEGKVKDLREQIIAKAVNPDETITAEKPYHLYKAGEGETESDNVETSPDVNSEGVETAPDSPELAKKYQALNEKRQKYIEMIKALQLKRWWKRPSDAEQELAWKEYKDSFDEYCLDKAEEMVTKLGEKISEVEWQQKYFEHIITMKIDELRQMSAISAEIASDGRFDKFKEWWVKHKRIRLGIGLGLMGVGFATGPLGAGTGIALGLAVAKGAVSGTGAFMASESGMQMAQDRHEAKSGDTKYFTDEEVEQMGLKRVDNALGARLAKAIEQGKDATIDPQTSELMAKLQERYRQAQQEEIAQLLEQGNSDSEVAAIMLGERLDEENTARVEASKTRGWTATGIRVGSIAIGLAVGAGTFGLANHVIGGAHGVGTEQAPAAPAHEAFRNYAWNAHSGAGGQIHGATDIARCRSAVDLYSQDTGVHLSPAEHHAAVRWLWDRQWGAGVRHQLTGSAREYFTGRQLTGAFKFALNR
ncbi:MAG TPA: hypothetical protein VMR51_01160 [Patescibacteria group bacterium]|nr:hypothetical protein [Patescibacteria group bacterium]